MKPRFFSFRNRFDFSPERYALGRPFLSNRDAEDNFFVLRIYELDESEFASFYDYQLNKYLRKNPDKEEEFFNNVEEIIQNRIKYFKRKDPFDNDHAKFIGYIYQLKQFLKFLSTVDQWHKNLAIDKILEEKEKQVENLKLEIEELKSQLKELTLFEATEKIKIAKGKLPAFMHLIRQIQKLLLPNGNKLVNSQAYSPWYKMVAKNFLHGERPIPIATAQNYLSSPTTRKYAMIADEDKIFQIIGPQS